MIIVDFKIFEKEKLIIEIIDDPGYSTVIKVSSEELNELIKRFEITFADMEKFEESGWRCETDDIDAIKKFLREYRSQRNKDARKFGI